MSKKNYDIILGVLFMALAVYVYLTANTYPEADSTLGYGAGLFPKLIAGLMFLLSLVVFLKAIISKKPEIKEKVEGLSFKELKHPALVWVVMLGFCLLMKPIGFLLDAIIFLFITAKLIYKADWKSTIIASIATPLIIWLIFKVAMKIPLPVGTLWKAMGLF